MLTEIHCVCGHREEVEPETLEARWTCASCGKTLQFGQVDGDSQLARLWLVIGGRETPPRIAVPIPLGLKLTIGSAPGSWLVLPGEEIAERHVELGVGKNNKVVVRSLSKESPARINVASILTGVLRVEDVMRLGSYALRLQAGAVPQSDAPMLIPKVEITIEDEEPSEEEDFDEPVRAIGGGFFSGLFYFDRTTTQIIRLVVCLAVVLGAGGYLVSQAYWPYVSDEMPADTLYRCPVDGETFRANWADGPPQCPICGGLCYGSMKQDAGAGEGSSSVAVPTTAPASQPADVDASLGEDTQP